MNSVDISFNNYLIEDTRLKGMKLSYSIHLGYYKDEWQVKIVNRHIKCSLYAIENVHRSY